MTVTEDGRIQLDIRPSEHSVKPAVYPMMKTIMELYQPETIGIILMGMDRKGCSGVRAIKENGGRIAQNKKTLTVFSMPKIAIKEGNMDKVLHLSKNPYQLMLLC